MQFFRNHAQLFGIVILLFVIWDTPAVWPLKMLVVLFHEMAHGLAAVLTGGGLVEIGLSANEGGFAVTRGGSRWVISSAGYLGSLLIGVVLFVAAVRSHADRWVAGIFGLISVLTAVFFVEEVFGFWFIFGTGVVMMVVAWLMPHDVTDLMLRVIGLASMIYAPFDILSDTIWRDLSQSDAANIARELGGTAQMWGYLWLGLSIFIIAGCCRWGLGARSNIDLPWLGRGT